MFPIIIDAAIILLLAFFTWRGAKKGLILTLFSLLAVFVAWFGASYISSTFAKPVANIIRPSIQNTVTDVLRDQLPTALTGSETSQTTAAGEEDGENDPAAAAALTLRQVLAVLEESELYPGFRDYLEDAVAENALKVTTTAAGAVSAYLADLIASALLFGLSFLLILLVWFLVSRALDLAFRLPVLNAVNLAGGGLFGLVKGLVVVMVSLWLAKLAGVLTEENIGPVASLMTVEKLTAALNSIITGG